VIIELEDSIAHSKFGGWIMVNRRFHKRRISFYLTISKYNDD